MSNLDLLYGNDLKRLCHTKIGLNHLQKVLFWRLNSITYIIYIEKKRYWSKNWTLRNTHR